MLTNVMLRVTAVQRDEQGKEDTVTLSTQGICDEREDCVSISYEETVLVGMAGTKTILTMDRDGKRATLVRQGTTTQEQEYILGAKTRSVYHMPFGDLEMIVTSRSMDCNVKDGKGTMRLTYDIELKGLFVHLNEIQIEIGEETWKSERN